MFHISKSKLVFRLHDEIKVCIEIYTVLLTMSSQTCILFFGIPGIFLRCDEGFDTNDLLTVLPFCIFPFRPDNKVISHLQPYLFEYYLKKTLSFLYESEGSFITEKKIKTNTNLLSLFFILS